MVNKTGGTSDGFTLQPHLIPELRKAYGDALGQLDALLGQGPFGVAQPAMADQASTDFQTAFNQFTDSGPGSMRESLVGFQQRLREAVDKLGAIQQAYDRNESETAAMLSRQLEP